MDRPGLRLAEAVRQRRAELRISRQQVATRAEIATSGRLRLSVSTLANVENGHSDRYAPDTLDALDAGLDWPPGTAQSTLEGTPETAAPSIAERAAFSEQAHLDRLVAVAVPARKLTDAEAILVVLGCLTDEQFAMFARAVQADDRFAVS